MDEQRSDIRLPGTFDSGIIYTILAIYMTYLSSQFLKINFSDDIMLILSEVLFIAVPPLLLAAVRKYDIKKTFRLKAPRPLEVLVMLLISPVMIIASFSVGFMALVAIKQTFGNLMIGGGFSDIMSKHILWAVFIVAVVPAFCEELLFRGLIQRGLEKMGAFWSIFLSGLLFGLFHFDFQRLAAQMLIGFISAYVVYRTGSIFNGMILHFMNNGLLTLLVHLSSSGAATPGAQQTIITDPFEAPEFIEAASNAGLNMDQFLNMVMIILGVILAVCLFLIFGMLIVLRAITKKTFEKPVQTKGNLKGLLFGIPGLALILIVYTSIGLSLLQNPLGKEILRFMGIS